MSPHPEAESLQQVAALAGHSFATPAEALDAILRLIVNYLGVRTGYLTRLNPEDGMSEVLAAYSAPGGSDVQPGGRSAPGETFCGAITLAPKPGPVSIPDTVSHPLRSNWPSIGSYLGVPILLSDGTLFGTLCGVDPAPRELLPGQAELLVILSRLVATHLEREREAAARRVTEETLKLRNRAISASTSGIVIADARQADQPLVFANEAFLEMAGYASEEVLGRNCRLLQGPATDRATVAMIAAAIREGRDCRVTLLNYRKDGTRFWNQVFVSPVRNADGVVTHFVGVQHDVTADRDVARLKDELAAVVSHELRSPLASIVGFAELLETRDVPVAERKTYLRTISEEGRRLSTLIDEFLELQRTEDQTQVLKLGPHALLPLLEHAVRVVGPDPLRPIHVEMDSDLPAVLVNADAVHRVLINLLSNARKYSPNGGAIVLAAQRAGEFIEVSVLDEGLGLTPEVVPRLFEKFYRVDSADRRGIKGTGLGLAIVKQLVELHGGRIEASSEGPGRGSRFTFTLSMAEPSAGVRPGKQR